MTRDHIDQNLRCGADRLPLLLSLIDERLSFSVQALRLFDNRLSPISLRARMTRPAFVSRWTLKGAGSGSGCVVIMFRANTGQMVQRLLRRRRKRWQCVDVARIVLNDDGRLVIRRDLLRRIDRCGSEKARRLLRYKLRNSFEIFGVDRPARWATAAPDEAHQAIGDR
jgi:hypothetical protein